MWLLAGPFCDTPGIKPGELARPVEQGDGTVPIFQHPYGRLGKVVPVEAFGDLQDQIVVSDGIVQPGDAGVLRAQDVGQIADKGDESRAFLRSLDGKAGIVLSLEDIGQPGIGRLNGGDPVQPQQGRQAPLQRVPQPLNPAPPLRGVGRNVLDMQLRQCPPDLRWLFFIDLAPGLWRVKIMASAVGIE